MYQPASKAPLPEPLNYKIYLIRILIWTLLLLWKTGSHCWLWILSSLSLTQPLQLPLHAMGFVIRFHRWLVGCLRNSLLPWTVCLGSKPISTWLEESCQLVNIKMWKLVSYKTESHCCLLMVFSSADRVQWSHWSFIVYTNSVFLAQWSYHLFVFRLRS